MKKKIFAIVFCMIASPAIAQQAGAQAIAQIGGGSQDAVAALPDLTGQDSNTGTPQALVFLKQSGVDLTYLGDDGGVRGYLGVSPDGKSQTFYVWPNNTDFAIGPLYNNRGENVSSDQITLMQNRYSEAKSGQTVTPVLDHNAPPMNIPPGMDPKTIPALSPLAKKGDNFIYLGGDGGSPGYFISNSSQQPPAYTTVYVTPDGKHDVIGIMIGELGENVTAKQVSDNANLGKIKAIVTRQAEAQATPETQNAVAAAASPEPPAQDTSPVASAPQAAPQAAQPAPQTQLLATASPTPQAGAPAAAQITTPPAIQPPPTAPAAPTYAPANQQAATGAMGGGLEAPPATIAAPAVSEQAFMSAVIGAAKFRVGYPGNPGPPVVYLIADPQCPHCHEAWEEMKPLIMAHKITVQVILVDALPGSSKLSEEILTNPRPGLVWLNGWADHPELIQPSPAVTGADYQQAQTYLADNMAFVNTFKKTVDGKQVNTITAVPFIAYKGNDGIWRAEQGPPDVAAFLAGDQ